MMAPKSKELTPDVKKSNCRPFNPRYFWKRIGELLEIKPRTVQNFRKRYRERGNIENFLEVAGKKDAPRDDRTLLRIVRSNRRSTLEDVTAKWSCIIRHDVGHYAPIYMTTDCS